MRNNLRRWLNWRHFCLALLMILPFTLLAAEVQYPARPTKSFYVDEAHLLDLSAMQKINQTAGKLWQEQHIPLIVVTIPSLAAYHAENMDVASYANALFNHWGIGSQNRNYGILFLIAKDDHKARIELGRGFEHRYDESSHQIMENIVIPAFKQNQFSAGIVSGVEALDTMARGLGLPAIASQNQNAPQASGWSMLILALVGAGIIALIVSLFRSGRSGWGWLAIAGLGGLIWYFLSSSSGGNGGGSDDSFGGGSSDGGGSSGSW